MLWRSFKKLYIPEISILILFAITYIICRILNITCLFYKLTNIPCPCCNMTRALLSLAKGNFQVYAKYNIMALPVALAFLSELFVRYCGKYKLLIHIFSIAILCINLLYYVIKLINR